MANGFCPYVLNDLQAIAGIANPAYKINMHGFIEMLHTAGNPDAITITEPMGHKKEVHIKFRQRYTKAQTDTALACDQVLTPSRLEDTVSVNNVRQMAIHIPDELIAVYCQDASVRQLVKGAMPSTSAANEVIDNIMSAGNALIQGVNDDLLNILVFGKNRVNNVSGLSPTTINLPKTTEIQPIGDGITKVLTDYNFNTLTGRPQVVGAGLMYGGVMQQAWKNTDFAGYNSKIPFGMIDFYPDQDFEAKFGSNFFGVFEPGALQFVQYKRYTGFKAGQKGISEFGMLPLPMYDPVGNMVKPVWFDYQFRYSDCPQTITDAYSGSPLTVDKGWTIILSITFGLYQISSSAYRNDDPNSAVNGSLLYKATNACDTCP